MSDYSGYIGVAGEGHRFGLMSCLQCGAAITVGFEEEDSVGLHDAWHDFLGDANENRPCQKCQDDESTEGE